VDIQFDSVDEVKDVTVHFVYSDSHVDVVANAQYHQSCPTSGLRVKFGGNAQVTLVGVIDSSIPFFFLF
jgi:hypothetical protein